MYFVIVLIVFKCEIGNVRLIGVLVRKTLLHPVSLFYVNQPPQLLKRVITFSYSACLTGGHDQAKHKPMFKNTAEKSDFIEEGCFWLHTDMFSQVKYINSLSSMH